MKATALAGEHEQMIANVAHQLRYPLVPIRNAVALLRRDSVDPATIRRVADIIDQQTSGMNRLIGDLVDVSRLELGALVLHRTRFTLAGLIEQAMVLVCGLATERRQTLSISLSPDPVDLHIDLPRLSSALQHIIANACKFTDQHGHIVIRAHRHGASAVITVTDTGVGILAADLESIFRPFAQCGHGSRVEPGLGLGLYLARRLIEAHSGTVIASSEGPGRGSVFTVRLPCVAPVVTLRGPADAAPGVDPIPA